MRSSTASTSGRRCTLRANALGVILDIFSVYDGRSGTLERLDLDCDDHDVPGRSISLRTRAESVLRRGVDHARSRSPGRQRGMAWPGRSISLARSAKTRSLGRLREGPTRTQQEISSLAWLACQAVDDAPQLSTAARYAGRPNRVDTELRPRPGRHGATTRRRARTRAARNPRVGVVAAGRRRGDEPAKD